MYLKNNHILFVVKLPPPITGATKMNKYVIDNPYLSKYKIKLLSLHYKSNNRGSTSFNPIKFFKFFYYITKLIKLILVFKPCVIYFQPTLTGPGFIRDIFFLLIFKFFNINIINHLHGYGIKNEYKSWFFRQLYNISFTNTHLIVLSKNHLEDIVCLSPRSTFIVNNGINDVKVMSKTADSRVVRILYFGYIDSSKGIIELLTALKIIYNNKIKFRCDIYGVCKDIPEQTIQQNILSLETGKSIKYHGEIYNNLKNTIYKNSDIFVHPTNKDAFPLTILEAMRAGLPVISTNVGSIPEIILNEKTGYIIEPGDVENLAQKLSILVNNNSLRIKFGEAGRGRYLEKYNIDLFNKNIEKVFNTVLKNK